MKVVPLLFASAVLALSGCTAAMNSRPHDPLVGAWRSSVHFDTGDFAALTDLEFLYVFNAGGTMTESSNYDAYPPVAPAYGSWTHEGGRAFLATYEFFVTKPPSSLEELTAGAGWGPNGRGRFEERIEMASDGRSFDSTFKYTQFKTDGSVAASPVTGRAHAERIVGE